MLSFMRKKVTPFPKKKVVTSEKVTTSEEVDKGINIFDNMNDALVMVRRKYLDDFEGQYKGSTGWFNPDHEFFKRKFSTLEPDFYYIFYQKDIECQDMEPYKTFVLPFDTTKLFFNAQ